MPKYELFIEYEGTIGGAADFAREIKSEFGCPVLINELDTKGNVIRSLEDWQREWDKADKVDRTG